MTDAGTFLAVGAGPGIGLAAARRFARAGYRVGLIARDTGRLARLRDVLVGEGATVHAARADLTDHDALAAAVGEIRQHHGPIEVMLFSPRPSTAWIKPVLDTTPSDVASAVGLSVVSAAAAAGLVVPDMRRRRSGTLLFTTGGAAVEPHRDRAVSGIAYAAETTYVRMLHDALAGDGVHAAQVTIVGAVGPDGPHRPEDVAEELWRRHERRDQPLVVLR